MRKSVFNLTIFSIAMFASTILISAQGLTRELRLEGGTISVVNLSGRVDIVAKADATTIGLTATSSDSVSDSEVKVDAGGILKIEALPVSATKRIDISLSVPERVRLKVVTREGEVRVTGDLESVEVSTDTGTIAADVPLTELRYNFFWTASRPRFLSDVELDEVKEKAGGKFQLKGVLIDGQRVNPKARRLPESDAGTDGSADTGNGDTTAGEADKGSSSDGSGATEPAKGDKKKKKKRKDADQNSDTAADTADKTEKKSKPRTTTVALDLTTARGIILLNVPPSEVSSDLRERPLTSAAKAIVRSGDVVLMDAIRRASPKYFGEYARTLPPAEREPRLSLRAVERDLPGETVKEAVVRVTDISNRAIPDLKASDFTVSEVGTPRDIISVKPHTAPVNLVLLLDVSGSVDNYVNFIRKAARSFVDTVHPGDRISLVLFNDDVKVLSGFSTNKQQLSESLDTFDAGGATAYYDAIAFTLSDTLRPLKGERTAIVILTDGDDNRSFLSFDSLVGAIEESGALIYPLYVPSALIAASETNNPEKGIDPLRTRYMTLSARAEGEGERLAKVSGGVYYPITQLSQIQKAYDDIVQQIRTAYTITYRSGFQADKDNRPSPRMKVRVNRPNAFVQVASVKAN